MKKIRLSKFNALVIAAVLAFSGAALMAQDANPAPNGARTDGQIEMDVVHTLDASEALKNDLITAATIQSEVTLSGTVASDADRQLAESIVRKVPGVTGVKNNLKVGNPAQDAAAQGAPDDSTAPPVADDQGYNNPPQDNQQPAYGQQPNQGPQQQQPPSNNQDQGYNQQPGYGQQSSNTPPPPPGYGQGYPAPPPGYGRQPYASPAPNYSVPNGPITILPGTVVQVRTNDSLDNKRAKDGSPVDFTVIRDVLVNGYLAIPRGATVRGVVTESKGSGQLTGSAELGLRLTSLEMGGGSYPIESDEFRVKSPSRTGRTVGNAIGGAVIGALIGGAAGGGGGAAIGAVTGGSAGTAASAIGSGPRAWIPAEALVTFHLSAPLTVNPVSREEAMRLAQGLYPGGPELHRRGVGYYAYPRPYPYGNYPYPPVYYRPYYMVNGYYYWR